MDDGRMNSEANASEISNNNKNILQIGERYVVERLDTMLSQHLEHWDTRSTGAIALTDARPFYLLDPFLIRYGQIT
ncbi:hypothetical protein KIN20_011397 [Parelaphostrongylus tenuis]|uniref:Uncharacterized protein n=1 Tax=Parelaphostrongylus tenuis TaxID=148309 RepID=A0AAD5MAV9_PARTN|nr:hypothetical protein KIN20_011397 [Parelaphostrongylus tenuis]